MTLKSVLLGVMSVGAAGLSGCCSVDKIAGNNPNYYAGSDSERIEKALDYAVKNSLPLEITVRKSDGNDQRDYWLIDRAIMLPGNMELRIIDCRIKLSDQCRDNMIRSANCIVGAKKTAKISNIKIKGIGKAVLEGADRPRSTGDSGKVLGERTYGSDAGKADESQYGDWRNIGILLVDVDNFEIENLKIVNSHCWAISLEYCTHGKIHDLEFDSSGSLIIDGEKQRVLNQDGVDLRRGCQYIDIENITGWTGDDIVALTATGVTKEIPETGRMRSTMFCAPEKRGAEDDVHHVNIRNIIGYCAAGHHIIRLLNNGNVKIHDVLVENVKDTSNGRVVDKAAVKIGDKNYGGYAPLGDTYNITVRNVETATACGVLIQGSLSDSVIENVKALVPERPVLTVVSGMEYIRNVKFPENIKQSPDGKLEYFAK